ncbi:MAG: MBL fold metallo-hydrolase [Pantoea sp.]|uniref:MBL fold metallo-hydrolase n=1 Tax=Pantoea sp. TaxID=69393 RepID=UPI00290F8849|nr:MBL fold metallo-hydrolase [Pantoea sp.]MDU7840176.1 MBL fold metallo-hydrolase [Pantoea sp.]
MTTYLCNACGTAYPDSDNPPEACKICDDERQYVPASGQSWTEQNSLNKRHRNAWRLMEPGLFCLQTVPAFAINQRAFLITTPAGNILWDCIALLDDSTREIIHSLGGLKAIAISHPHYYTTMQDWAKEFDCPVYLHESDKEWIVRPDGKLHLWQGREMELFPGCKLICLGGHFAGGTVMLWSDDADKKGVILAGDIVQITPGAHHVSFMWSYPNMLPLPVRQVKDLNDRIQPYCFEKIYGAFEGQDVLNNGKEIIAESARRYIQLLNGDD